MRNRKKHSRTSNVINPVGLIIRLLLVGTGLGVIAGTSLKFIALQKETSIKISDSVITNIHLPVYELFNNIDNSIEDNYIDDDINVSSKEIVQLSTRWRELANRNKDLNASAFMVSLDSGSYAQFSPNSELSAASSIKIPILLVTLQMIDQGKLSWNENLKLSKEVIGGGSGWMAYRPLSESFPVYEIATEMIRISDNTATNLLIQRVGGFDEINKQFRILGLNNTKINNWLPDLQGTNTTSARDLALVLALADQGEVLSTRTRDLFREVMATSVTNRLLPGGLLKGLGGQGDPDSNLLIKGFRVYNKTGDIGIAYADAGLIQMPDNTRAVAGFIVEGPFNDPRSSSLIREMSSAMAPILLKNHLGNQN